MSYHLYSAIPPKTSHLRSLNVATDCLEKEPLYWLPNVERSALKPYKHKQQNLTQQVIYMCVCLYMFIYTYICAYTHMCERDSIAMEKEAIHFTTQVMGGIQGKVTGRDWRE